MSRTVSILIDADPIVYRSGFAAQKNITHVVAEDKSGRLAERYFKGENQGAQIAEWLTKFHLTELTRDVSVEAEPVSHALYLVKQEIEGIKEAIAKQYGKRSAVGVYLTGPGNYREAIAKQRPYKGNRDPAHKPVHYQAIRDYLVDRQGAVVVAGREADDEVSIRAWRARRSNEKAVVATIDKDLDQIPGPHYDYRQKVFYDVTEELARRWFWIQCIAGDATDNVPGAYRMGKGKASEFVDGAILKRISDSDLWSSIVGIYGLTAQNAGCPYSFEDHASVALETAQLVYIQQRENELWMPPGTPYGTVGGGGIDD